MLEKLVFFENDVDKRLFFGLVFWVIGVSIEGFGCFDNKFLMIRCFFLFI